MTSLSSMEAPARTKRPNENINFGKKILRYVKKKKLMHKVNKVLTSSLFNAVTDRPSPPDQSWSCYTEGHGKRKLFISKFVTMF